MKNQNAPLMPAVRALERDRVQAFQPTAHQIDEPELDRDPLRARLAQDRVARARPDLDALTGRRPGCPGELEPE